MKRNNFTLTELLTVIVIIAILAAILLPTFGYIRQRSRRTGCLSNQGQTMKMIEAALNKSDRKFHSGTTFAAPDGDLEDNESWTSFLAEKKALTTMEAFRCPSLNYSNNGKKLNNDSLAEAYGVVFTKQNNGKLNFKGNQLLKTSDGTEISPKSLMIGSCSADSKNNAQALLVSENGFENKISAPHLGTVNIFFLDGSVATLDKEKIATEVCYYPVQKADDDADDYGEAKKLNPSNSNWQE